MRLKKRFVAWLLVGVMVVSSVQFPVSHVHAGEIQTDEVVAETNEKETENTVMESESDKEYKSSVTEEQKEFSEEHEETEQVATETENDNSIQDESELESNMETEERQEENKAVDISDAKVVTSGSCGEKITYVLDSDGVLTISGSGDMKSPALSGLFPWFADDCGLDIKSVVIENGVTGIGDFAFKGCSNLISVEIPESIESIGYWAFDGCENMNAVYISNIESWCSISFGPENSNPLSCAYNLYLNKRLVEELIIPNSVEKIESWAFAGCSSLKSIEIPDSVIKISDFAFSGCSNLACIKILNSNCVIYDESTFLDDTVIYGYDNSTAQAYAEKYNRKFVLLDEEPAEVISGKCGENVKFVLDSGGTLTISGSGEMYDFEWIDGSFPGWHEYLLDIKTIVIEDGVTGLGYKAFINCSNLTDVKISSTVIDLGECTFWGCNNLINIEIPEGVTYLLDNVFLNCSNLKNIKIPSSVMGIGKCAFQGCSSLVEIEIPSSVMSINGWCVFEGCDSLQKITFYNPNCSIYDDSSVIPASTTIYGYDNSTAQAYAEKYKRKFVTLNEKNGVELLLPKSDDSTLSGPENWIMLSGTLRVDNDSLDIESEISAIKWKSSDNLIVNENDIICKKSSLIDNKSTKLTIAIKAKGCGVVTLIGTTSSETSSSCELTIEPEMILESEDLNSNKVRNITCTVNIPNSNRDYLNQFMKGLTWNIPDTDVSIVNKKGTYNIGDNGKSATYTLQVIPKINNGKTEIAFISPKGHVTRINKSVDIYPSWGFENYCAPKFKASPAYNELFMKQGLSGMFYFVLKQDTVKNGVCHGMAVTALLMEQDEYNYREFDNTKDSLYRIDELSDTIDRFIQYYYMMQFTKVSKEFGKNFQKNSVKKQLEIIASMKEPFLLGYSSIKGGHTVVGYKIEEGRWISGATGRIYPKRVVVYDSNNVNGNDDGRNFLFDEDNGTWEVPAYYVKYKFSSDFSLSKITCATSDQNDFCNIDLTRASRADEDSVALTLVLNSDINVELNKNRVNGVVNHVHNICGPYYSEKDDVFATPIMGINDSVEDTVPNINIYMPKTDKVIIKPKTEGVSLDGNIWYSNSFGLDFSAERYNAVKIDSDGSVSMLGSLGNFNITTVLESDIFSNVDGISIDGKGEGSVSTKIAKDGIILRADRLDGFKVSIYDVESNSTISGVDLSTDKESVLIDTTNDDHLSILEDSNGDGQYNYEITRIDYNDNDTYKITYDVDGGIVEGNPTSYTEDVLPIKLNNPTITAAIKNRHF